MESEPLQNTSSADPEVTKHELIIPNPTEIDSESEDQEESAKGVFDPRLIDISVEQQNIDFLLAKLEYDLASLDQLDSLEQNDFDPNVGIIDLNTEFQRSPDLWSGPQMSRLIESLIIRFPIPPFYFDTTDRYRWQVVDGLQRLSSLRKFVVEKDEKKKLRLSGLQFLPSLEGKAFNELNENLQRAVRGAQVVIYLIRAGTPKQVKYRLFERINTSALTLTYQEIRHALNIGIPAKYVKDLTDVPWFKKLIRLSAHRMQDRELALRYLAFRLANFNQYEAPMFAFLDQAMEKIYKMSAEDRERYQFEFDRALEVSATLFGPHLFSRSLVDDTKPKLLNKALFEVWTVTLGQLTNLDCHKIEKKRDLVIELFKAELIREEFIKSISQSTAGAENVRIRFRSIQEIIEKALADVE